MGGRAGPVAHQRHLRGKFTTSGLDVNGAVIGQRWRVGPDVVLEVSGPRIPCATFQGWLERAGRIKQFTEAARPGAYLRVIKPGHICAGDLVEIVQQPGHDVTVALTFRALTRNQILPGCCRRRTAEGWRRRCCLS